jgi:hypothetical protein
MTGSSANPDELEGPGLGGSPHLTTGGVDPDLLALPAPPRARRRLSLALLAAVMVAAGALLLQLRADLVYAFAAERPTEIGDAATLPLADLVPNSYVRVRGTPMLSRMVRYERALSGEAFAVFPLAGQRQIFVQVPLAALQDPARTQGEFRGRMLTFGQLGGRLRPVRKYLARSMNLPVTAESFVVLAEEPPSAYGWALALCSLCAAIMALAAGLMLRWFRPLAHEP